MSKKKVLMVGTTAAMSEQFNKNNIEILTDMGYKVHVVGNWKEGNPISDERLEAFKIWLKERGCRWFHWDCVRKPVSPKNIKAFRFLNRLMTKYRYEFMHCYTPIGSVIGRLVAKRHGVKTIYTAHGFHFYTGAPIINWLVYYPAEWLMSWATDMLITINREDYWRAKRHLHAKTTFVIPGVGIDIDYLRNLKVDIISKREEIGIHEDDFMVISVGELNENKNQRVIIEALEKIKNRDKKCYMKIHYVIVGKGYRENELKNLTIGNGLSDHVHFLGFRDDVPELLKTSDVFVLPSKREGLSVALMEAIACDIPCIVSNIRGNKDIIDGYNGVVVSDDEWWMYIIRAYKRQKGNIEDDDSTLADLGIYNKSSISHTIVNEKTKNFYSSINSHTDLRFERV